MSRRGGYLRIARCSPAPVLGNRRRPRPDSSVECLAAAPLPRISAASPLTRFAAPGRLPGVHYSGDDNSNG